MLFTFFLFVLGLIFVTSLSASDQCTPCFFVVILHCFCPYALLSASDPLDLRPALDKVHAQKQCNMIANKHGVHQSDAVILVSSIRPKITDKRRKDTKY